MPSDKQITDVRSVQDLVARSEKGGQHDVVDRKLHAGPGAGELVAHYSGPATISDGVIESLHDVEIHTRTREHRRAAAWHAIISGRLPAELRSPHGKTLSVRLPNGRQGVGVLVDPHLVRGAGEPPAG